MAELRQGHPDTGVELWCEDEARLGLKPVVRRVWALKGTRPTSNGRHEFESLFVYGFANPTSRRSRFLILPKASAECMGQARANFAGWADSDGREVPVVILGGSGGHTAKRLEVPPDVVLHRQPACTPERQPAEHVCNRVYRLTPFEADRQGLVKKIEGTRPAALSVPVVLSSYLAGGGLRTRPQSRHDAPPHCNHQANHVPSTPAR